MEFENWKAVVGYEGLYEVSDLGRVRSLDRVVAGPRGPQRVRGRLRRLAVGKEGYLRITLLRDGMPYSQPVHRVVLQAFIGPSTEGRAFVNHKDFDKSNNRLPNLEWVSADENMAHARDGGRLHPATGLNKRGTLDLSVVDRIRELGRERQLSNQAIADLFGVTKTKVAKIVCGKTWNTVDQAFPRTHNKVSAASDQRRSKKLTIESVREIRRLGALGEHSQSDLGRMFGIAQTTVGGILRGRYWYEQVI